MKKIAIFASGSGSNFEAIAAAIENGELDAEISLVVCDRPGAKVEKRAEAFGIPVLSFYPKSYESKADFETFILQQLNEAGIEWIILAGYMRLIGPILLQGFEGRIINIHPSLLPSFPGKDAIGQAFEAGVKLTGVTVHFVDEGMDTGQIIEQDYVRIDENDTKEDLGRKIQAVEHLLYPAVIRSLLEEKIKR
ncbi:phosphoribosylglycinamide formyltransferase [Pseudalkalibacillus hwajinpoensis]|uniref:Phosphoribosylglycinamide formyltransferase n=1 Tax=Guptibacillus hwajinpoensis TaxID=208199 RepID=A0A4U1MCB0_9BACL|nr:phosphoribosylglycinamide formyltransferase [Pseudalkalibacillus hwajinpoensis]TKD68211.1 phosphoribosylglycinamide formyltransferase [Pseudalkalibacillus hwajinpoensis]